MYTYNFSQYIDDHRYSLDRAAYIIIPHSPIIKGNMDSEV